ncbi:MAG: glycosyltransferase family 9 protein [Acidobacteria bacterium]|nr:glycosyltransferase family 9 protein [Acidobacteriota bacterium]
MKETKNSTATQSEPEKILVIRLSAIGDVVRTVPAVDAIRQIFPAATIHWLVEDRCAAILKGFPAVDELKQVPRKGWKKMGLLKRIPAVFRFIRGLRREKYSLVIDFHGILKSGLYARLSGCKRRAGYPKPIAKEWNTLFTNEKIPAVTGVMSRYDRNFLLPRYFDRNVTEQNPGLPVSAEDRKKAESFLAKYGIGLKTAIFLYPGTSSRGRYKRWSPENYGKLADMIQLQLQLPVLVGWGPGEENIVDRMLETANAAPVVLPSTSMKELAAFIGASRVFVGGDTGPMHISSLMGTPVVTIFGPSDPVVNEPARFTPFKIVTIKADCSPCRNKKCPHLKCLTAVTPETVMAALSELMQKIESCDCH